MLSEALCFEPAKKVEEIRLSAYNSFHAFKKDSIPAYFQVYEPFALFVTSLEKLMSQSRQAVRKQNSGAKRGSNGRVRSLRRAIAGSLLSWRF